VEVPVRSPTWFATIARLGASLIFVACSGDVDATAPAAAVEGRGTPTPADPGPRHHVVGVGETVFGAGTGVDEGSAGGRWSFRIDVRERSDGVVEGSGQHELRFDVGADLKLAFALDCLEVDAATGEAWASGIVSESSGSFADPHFRAGTGFFVHVRDAAAGGRDRMGGTLLPAGQDCHDRPMPQYTNPVRSASFVVR
jgi:hypothetical protein